MMKGLVMIRWMLVAVVLCVVEAGASPLADEVRGKAIAILDSIEDTRSAQAGADRLEELADAVAASASKAQLDAIGIAEGYLSIAEMLAESGERDLGGFADALVATPAFTVELGLLIDAEHDNLRGVARSARELLDQRGKQVERYAKLSSAICVVHDEGRAYTRQINENTVQAPSRLAIFDYFVNNSQRMAMSLDSLSPALLVHVVNMTETPEQNWWALNRYANNTRIGDRFFDIQYDTAHLRSGTIKKVTAAGNYSLESIAQHGGVCADQAYFAEGVGKAMAIPTAYVYARGSDVSHAWIGFLEIRGRRTVWNFDSGRYDEYQKLRGYIQDPQSGERVTDARVGLLGGQFGFVDSDRYAALGVHRAVRRMLEQEKEAGSTENNGWAPSGDIVLETRGLLKAPRDGGNDDQLELLRAGLERCAFVPAGWELLIDIAKRDQMTRKELDFWARAVERMCGNRFQDFSYFILTHLITSVDDRKARLKMWDWAFDRYRARPDLAGLILINQGSVCERMGDKERAWWYYEQVSKRYINEGRSVLMALDRMQEMLDREGRRAEILPYLEDANRRVNRPQAMASMFAVQSNYFRIRLMLGRELEAAGRIQEARSVLDTIGVKSARDINP